MIRLLVRALISRFSIALIELLIVVPMALATFQMTKVLWKTTDLHEAMDIVSGVGIIMIALGVVLEERKAIREIFELTGGPDEARQEQLDLNCHHYGVGQLVFGLFAAMCIELIKIPNHIIYTGEADEWMVAGGTLFVVLGAFLLLRHAMALLLFKEKAAALEVAIRELSMVDQRDPR
jgi:hypothetical protein